MATSLPYVGQEAASAVSQPSMKQHRIPSPPAPKSTASGSLRSSLTRPGQRLLGKREREQQMKQQQLRTKQPELSKFDTAKHRNTYFHNLCQEMLKGGFHRSFSELFSLVTWQRNEREAAGPDSLIWNMVLLEDEHQKLDALKQHLVESELSLRNDDLDAVYSSQNRLAQHFEGLSDYWLSDHFYTACLNTSLQIKNDERRKEAEANCNMGLAFEKRKEYGKASDHFERFYQLTKSSGGSEGWVLDSGQSLHSLACQHLRRLYSTMAENAKTGEDKDLKKAVMLLQKAFDMAKESGDPALEGDVSYRLGIMYTESGDPETAIMHLEGYLASCKKLGDIEGIGKACEAMATAYESQGDTEAAVRYLQMFVDFAEKGDQDKALGRASICLGSIYNEMGEYTRATEYFGKAYNIAQSRNHTESIEESRILLGVATAHSHLEDYSPILENVNKQTLLQLTSWKSTRNEEFIEKKKESSSRRGSTINIPVAASITKTVENEES